MLHATQLKRGFHYSVKITKSITLFTIYTDTSDIRRDAFRTHRYTRDIDYFLDSKKISYKIKNKCMYSYYLVIFKSTFIIHARTKCISFS